MTTTLLEKKVQQLERRVNAMQKLFIPSTIARKSDLSARERRAILERTGGALKGKLKGNVLAWQRKNRRAWNRTKAR